MNERKLTKSELAKREDIIMKMKKNKRALTQKYGKDAEAVMYGRATKLAKKQAEAMDQDKIKELVKDALQNPKKADLNKDGKLSDYEKKRGAAIEKSMEKQDLKEFGSSDMSALLSSMHINLGYPKEFPGLSKIMDAAEDATDFYMDDFEEYSTNRDELVMSNARAYARREFPDFMAQASKFIEPIDEMDRNDPIAMRLRADKAKRAANAGDDGNDKFFRASTANAKKLAALKDKRAEIMRDMEQEAEMEGGPIADKYGDMLNKIDKAIAKLKGHGEWGPERDTDISGEEIAKRSAMFGLEEDALKEGASTEEKRIAMRAIKSIAKYRGVSNDEARNDLVRAAKEIGDLKEDLNEDNKINEENIGLADLEERGYEAGEKAAYTYGTLITKLQNRPDKLAFKKGFVQGVIDELGSNINEDLTEDLDLGHQDNEPHMLKADLYRIGKYAMELYQILDQFEGGSEEVDLPHWWQSKIIKSKDAIVGAKHYLDFELKEPQIDAMVDVAQEEEAIDEGIGTLLKKGLKGAIGSLPLPKESLLKVVDLKIEKLLQNGGNVIKIAQLKGFLEDKIKDGTITTIKPISQIIAKATDTPDGKSAFQKRLDKLAAAGEDVIDEGNLAEKVNEARGLINLKAAMDALNKNKYVDGVKIRQGNKFTGIKSIDVNTRLIGDLVVTKDGEVFWPYKDRTWGWDSPSIEHLIKTIEELSTEEELNPSNNYKLTEVNEDVINEFDDESMTAYQKAVKKVYRPKYDGSIQMPSQEEVDAFFKKIGQEDHHLANKPVFGDTEPWDGEDYSDWKNITRGHKLNEASMELKKLETAIEMFQNKIKKQGRVTNARDEEHLKNLIKVYKEMGGKKIKESVNEGVWSVGTSKEIKNIMGLLDVAMDIKDPQELIDFLDMHSKSMYNIVGDDVFHDDIDGAKSEAKEGNMDRAQNRLSDAYSRAAYFQEFMMDREGLKEEEVGEADKVASDIQKAMNKHKKDDAKMHQLKKARTAMNKGDLSKAKKIAARLAEKLKSN